MNFTNEEQEALNDGLVATRWAVERLRARPIKSIESTAILALAGVVELLAKGLVKAPTDQAQPENEAPTHAPGCTGLVLDIGGPFPCLGNGTCEVEPVKTQERPPGTFSDELVERLERVIDSAHETGTPHNEVACAILAELAKMPKLEKQLAEQTLLVANITRALDREVGNRERNVPVDASGKTPGRVMTEKAHELFYAPDKPETPFAWDRLSKAEQRRADETAQTVLRAFGNGAEVLRNVHQQIGNAPGEPSEYYQAIIDDELAKLPAVKPMEAIVAALQKVRSRIAGIERMSNDTEYGKQWAHVDELTKIIDAELAKLEPTSEHSPKT